MGKRSILAYKFLIAYKKGDAVTFTNYNDISGLWRIQGVWRQDITYLSRSYIFNIFKHFKISQRIYSLVYVCINVF